MSFLLTCVVKDLRRRLADPLALVLWFGIPLLLGGMMIVIFGGDNAVPPKARVLLVDEDASVAGQLLGFAGGQAGEMLDIERVTRETGYARMDAGEASALLVLPEGLSQAVLDEQPTTLTLVRNPAQVILPGIVQSGVEILIEGVFYAQQLLGPPLRQIRGETPDAGGFLPDQVVALFSGQVNERMRVVGGWLFPPVLGVEFVDTGPEATAPQPLSIGALFLPTMMFMAVLFIAQGMADDLWDEKQAGTLRRAVALPHPLATFLAAKLLAAAVIMAGVALAGLGVLLAMEATTPARAPAALAWLVYGGTAIYCYFLALQFFASTRRGAAILSSIVLFPAMMLGGAFFPLETMPAWMQAVGAWTPNGQALVRFKELAAGTATVEGLTAAALAIGVPAAAAFVLSARLAAGRFASGA